MADRLVWYVGDRKPAISENLTTGSGATPVNLSGSTVRFKMRLIGSSTLKVNQPATITNPPGTDGLVSYSWGASDTDTAGDYLIWWEVTDGTGLVQEVLESLITIRAHAAATNVYIELETFKSTADLTGKTFLDADIQIALSSASRAVDELCNRRFWLDADALQVQYYTPDRGDFVQIDDLVVLTSIKTDQDGDGVAETTWSSGDYFLEPFNAPTEYPVHPYTAIRIRAIGGSQVFWTFPRSLVVTGQFGWPSVPPAVVQATSILAGRFLKRSREAPFGAGEAAALGGAAIHLTGIDPDVQALLGPYKRHFDPFVC